MVAQMDVPGRWAGGFRAWDAQGVYLATGRGVVPGPGAAGPVGGAPGARRTRGSRSRGTSSTGSTTRRAPSSRPRASTSSLVTLGTLAAGLAHEINNPAAAATRAVDALERRLRRPAGVAGAPGRPGHPRRRSSRRSTTLRREARPVARRPRRRWPLADREQELADLAGAPRRRPGRGSWRRPLAVAGVDTAWCERAALVLPGRRPRRRPRLGRPRTFAVAALLAEVKESTRRISELVAAVRSYSQVDRASRAADRPDRGHREHAGRCSATSCAAGSPSCATYADGPPPHRRLPRRAQPGVDQPHRQRRRRHGRRGHADDRRPRRGRPRRRRGRTTPAPA